MAGTNNLVRNIWVAKEKRYIQEHVLIAEKALGKRLPKNACVHHIDCDPTNNKPSNLLICPDHAYHMLIHKRTRAYEKSGNANWGKCLVCKNYGPEETMNYNGINRFRWHKSGLGCKRC